MQGTKQDRLLGWSTKPSRRRLAAAPFPGIWSTVTARLGATSAPVRALTALRRSHLITRLSQDAGRQGLSCCSPSIPGSEHRAHHVPDTIVGDVFAANLMLLGTSGQKAVWSPCWGRN